MIQRPIQKNLKWLVRLEGGNHNLTYLMPDQQIVMKKYRLPLEYMIREVNFFHHCEFAPPLINYNLIKNSYFRDILKEQDTLP